MIARGVLTVLLTANGVMAADFCKLPMDKVMALPAALAGDWQMAMRGGIGVVDGKLKAMPTDGAPDEATFTADGSDLTLDDDGFFPATPLKHFVIEKMFQPDMALPGESPLNAVELLAPEITDNGLPCDPKTLPQFAGAVAVDGDATSTLRVYAFGPDTMVLVIKGESGGQAARAVFDLTRGVAK